MLRNLVLGIHAHFIWLKTWLLVGFVSQNLCAKGSAPRYDSLWLILDGGTSSTSPDLPTRHGPDVKSCLEGGRMNARREGCKVSRHLTYRLYLRRRGLGRHLAPAVGRPARSRTTGPASGCESHQKSRRMTLSGILRQFLSQTLEQQHVWCSLPDGTGEFWNKRWQGAYERFIYSDNLSFLLRPSRTAQSTKGGVELKETDGPRSPRPASHAVLRPRMPEANVSSPDAVLAT